jgi:hypothetical protein
MYNITLRHVHAITEVVEKAISITYSECVFVALVIRHEMLMHHIVICGLSGSKFFFSQTAQFSGNKVPEYKMCVLMFFITTV